MNINKQNQTGFTLVEIAIVLVIIGLLLGGILKGQELINSARVRALADTNSGIQAAYFGFIDRFRQVPGDWDAAAAATAIGDTTIGLPAANATVGNGRVDNTLNETAAAWEQLSKAGFIQGSFNPDGTETPTAANYNTMSPQNPFNGSLVLSRNDGYEGTNSVRLNLHLGANIPVNIARELDVKVDDARPATGVLRLSAAATGDTELNDFFAVEAGDACVDGTEYDITNDAQDCGTAFLY